MEQNTTSNIRDRNTTSAIKEKNLTRQLKKNTKSISNKIGFLYKIVFYNRIKYTISKEKGRLVKIHKKKLEKLHSERRYISKPKYRILKKIINNFSS